MPRRRHFKLWGELAVFDMKTSQDLLFSEARKAMCRGGGPRAQGLVRAGVVPTTPRSKEPGERWAMGTGDLA